ncbi:MULTISPECIES: acetate--CoA ligase family protein [unclassified Variovorax]|uniref:acetate--CoA ligase family protein n=1 Tax=unclassified Variovorax TaxID=663243 RepID=UPI000D1157B3|nr:MULTISPECIES: acetate--CoA ligase family protein [unclassified Variovorax]AVQ85501.1 6-carboxyhexanoate--CoA ligase [Variovorax sp. PMC12]QRY35119.1 acetate--CoA ligase family protein [Variovorax sp. PDNC026]
MQAVEVGRGMDALFSPRSIAIFGASDDVTKIGGRPLQFLQKYGYAGGIYPINRKGGLVQSLPAYASVDDVPEVPELAVVAVPPAGVLDVVRGCARRGVKAAVILSAGFSEMGDEGRQLQEQIGEVARATGMRVVGPNCLGAIGVPDRSIATFSVALESSFPVAGSVGIVSQSGNLGSFTLRLAGERGLGVSRMLTTGNECDVDIADAIASLAGDPGTRVILCCMETCRDGDKLLRAMAMAREAGKPLVVLKVGVSEAGSEAAASHTGALACSDAVFDAVLRKGGAIRVPSIEQLLEVGHALSVVGPAHVPGGNRVAVLTASGGFGVLLADAASAQGLALPKLAAHTQERILSVVPFASPSNPVDMTAQVSSRPEVLAQMLDAVARDASCDALILQSANAFHLPRLRDVFLSALEQLRKDHPSRLILLCARAPHEVRATLNGMGFPVVEGIDAACATLAALLRFGARGTTETAAAAIERMPLAAEAFATEASAKAVLSQAGLPVPQEVIAANRDEALAAARALGFPLVLKIVSPDIAHKTEVGGVFVGVQSEAQLLEEYANLLARVAQKAPEARIAGVLVAQMVQGGVELILGTKKDPVFGPMVMVGLGGIFAEIFKDVALQPAPVDEAQATAMLRSLKAFALLDGARGRPRADVQSAAKAVAALSRFAMRHAQDVSEIDINPLMVLEQGRGAHALDALLVPEEQTTKAKP